MRHLDPSQSGAADRPRAARERRRSIEIALSESAAARRRAPSPELQARILRAVDVVPYAAVATRAARRTRSAWIALAAAVLIAWCAWHAAVSPRASNAPTIAAGRTVVREALAVLRSPDLEQPLVAEVGHMRSDVSRAFDFLLSRVTGPLMTRASRD